ncbi:TonB-dependent receptor [Sphingomonas cavernae]|uniref:TonB-dependent receptor n=1 Tax=Sphingomonas cavernae TaxID=2320861 RepID=A0A418WQS1_9SPHN|nr:TonB-dependent receptor [Sphingomonas cavernae]RJF93592.1 TonB-dependent receptor [Sphingomonas cavernae]
MPKTPWLLSVACLAIATPVFAQDTTQQTADQPAPTSVDTGEIIVTAQGRAQALSDVPLAVSAVTAESLANTGANDIRQLNQIAPSLLVSSTGSEANGSARIRGIGTVGDNPGLESSVAVFIDGVYRSRSGIGLNELGEIDRVEVLRGPQGTLFGRNASAGLINIVSKSPSFDFGANVEATYGNYDYWRLAGGVTGPITDTLAARIDGVWVQRDGFYYDAANDTRVNDRDRYFVRGQLLFEPTSDLSVRVIGDYTKRDEKCCGATYVDNSVNPFIGNLNNPAIPLQQPGAVPGRTNDSGNNIINVLTALGQDINALNAGYSRELSVTPGRSYGGETEDYGASVEINWDFGNATLTSISGYRNYFSSQAGDIDYSSVDILYRADDNNSSRKFETFSQELRLQGTAFDDKLDWLIGAYYADEDLTATDNLRFGNQYGRFATCRIVSPGGLSALYSPTSSACLAARPPVFGAASPLIYAAMNNLDSINDRGSTLDVYKQNSRNYAFFTHNIIHVTSTLDVTLGLRYTNERKKFDATFGNDNTACVANQALVGAFTNPNGPAFNPALFAISQSILNLSCQGNSTAELNGVSINDRRSEDEFTGTAVLSWKPTDDLLLYGSYSRGYKAGGFNLDRSALKAPSVSFASLGGAQALVSGLQFDPEIVDAFEIGAKYATGPFSLNVAAFRQEFKNFQLNTFDGTVFIVQNVNGCGQDLGGADRDQSFFPGSANFLNPVIAPGAAFNLNPALGTGACAADDVGYGVSSTGVEIEASLVPARDLRVNLGFTYAETKYRNNLVGNESGAPLSPALRMLPGDNLSNAPEFVSTASLAWTPEIGGSGLSGLVYIDSRMTGDFNTGSDLFPQKEQDSYVVVNARLGIRGPDERWAVEFWAQNLFNEDYAQVAFNSPFQAGGSTTPPFAPGFTFAPFVDPQFPGGRQIFSQFLAEPRTYGITLRGKF